MDTAELALLVSLGTGLIALGAAIFAGLSVRNSGRSATAAEGSESHSGRSADAAEKSLERLLRADYEARRPDVALTTEGLVTAGGLVLEVVSPQALASIRMKQVRLGFHDPDSSPWWGLWPNMSVDMHPQRDPTDHGVVVISPVERNKRYRVQVEQHNGGRREWARVALEFTCEAEDGTTWTDIKDTGRVPVKYSNY